MRNEDLDHPKNKPGAMDQAIDDMKWLGFDWDEGPDIGGPVAPYVQSQRKEIYKEALGKLIARNLVYPCTCSRRDVESGASAPHEGDMLRYTGNCLGRYATFAEAEEAIFPRIPAWRFRTKDFDTVSFTDGFAGEFRQNVHDYCGDFVLARDAFGAGYMLAVVSDDSSYGVTEVIRGDDLLPATPAQLLIYKALGLRPPAFIHVPLIVGPDGKRLAKRHGDTRISTYRKAGIPPGRIIGMLAASCGWAAEGEELSLSALLPRFNLSTIPRHPFTISQL